MLVDQKIEAIKVYNTEIENLDNNVGIGLIGATGGALATAAIWAASNHKTSVETIVATVFTATVTAITASVCKRLAQEQGSKIQARDDLRRQVKILKEKEESDQKYRFVRWS